jgi:hypothetical protein
MYTRLDRCSRRDPGCLLLASKRRSTLPAIRRLALSLGLALLLASLLPFATHARDDLVAQAADKRCRSVSDISRLEIGPDRRPCATARRVARAWKRKAKCDPTGRAVRNCTIRLSRPWGCQAQAFEFDPESNQPYYVFCTRDFWHPMSFKPITAAVSFYW